MCARRLDAPSRRNRSYFPIVGNRHFGHPKAIVGTTGSASRSSRLLRDHSKPWRQSRHCAPSR
jgi:hypothetical protein